ncbi:hypothetical protein AB1Y20_015863 [Prymnesium parvum]|uniref:Protein-tyrosine sulfotransferase n=1 Tax=Prymnesium parvum TaxID=97485 RepID=A0AB34K471_PRYPA
MARKRSAAKGFAPKGDGCEALKRLRAVFIIALGRSGSSHLLHVLNSLPGYRISGETDNAWVHLGWFARARLAAGISARSGAAKKPNHTYATLQRKPYHSPLPASVPSLPETVSESDLLCSMRQLMLLLHNPQPHARVFGFKEIYSPFIRNLSLIGEVFSQGVEFIRVLFPRAKFIFHYRQNLSRAVNSDFWHRETLLKSHSERLHHFSVVVKHYLDYAGTHPDYCFASTLEGVTDKYNTTHLYNLFAFLEEPLTGRIRRLATARAQRQKLKDWSEERHTRRIYKRLANGSLVVETKDFAFTTQTAFDSTEPPHS